MTKLIFDSEPFDAYPGFDEPKTTRRVSPVHLNRGEKFEFALENELNRSSPDYIRWVQQSLNKILGLRLAVDGILGPQTRSAIRSFQQKNGLTVDGIVGPNTEAALKSTLGRAKVTTTTTTAPVSRSNEVCQILDNFDFDQDQLKPEHRMKLEAVARQIISSLSSAHPVRSVNLIGHTDPVGDYNYNLALGKRRAEQVANELLRMLERMQPGSAKQISITVESRGERETISNNPAQNRRVQVCFPPATPQCCVSASPPDLETETPTGTSLQPPLTRFSRLCCMLAPQKIVGDSNIADPADLGDHGSSSSEVNGLIYAGRAGFLDLAHIRDMCDMTKYIFDQLTLGLLPCIILAARTVEISGRKVVQKVGEAAMRACGSARPIDVARAIAYDVGLGHEIVSYYDMGVGGHNSSFSPEDLCSNFLGTLLAERAIAAGYNFNDAVTDELNWLIFDLDGQIQSETMNAFNLINGRWVNWTNRLSVNYWRYLMRRNFTRDPWKAGHSSDKPTPSYVIAPLPNIRHIWSYIHREEWLKDRPSSGFNRDIARIKQDASRAKRYGPNFDKP